MTSTPLELFWIAGSPFAWQVMLTLEAKQVPYMPRLLQGSQGDHKKPDFLALNPRGKVPVLRDGDFVMYESIAIMQFIEAKPTARSSLHAAADWQVARKGGRCARRPARGARRARQARGFTRPESLAGRPGHHSGRYHGLSIPEGTAARE